MSPWREPWLKNTRRLGWDGVGAAALGVAAAQSPGLPGLRGPRRWAATILGGEGHVAGWGGTGTSRGRSPQFPGARF